MISQSERVSENFKVHPIRLILARLLDPVTTLVFLASLRGYNSRKKENSLIRGVHLYK